jgi:hypothetical protein
VSAVRLEVDQDVGPCGHIKTIFEFDGSDRRSLTDLRLPTRPKPGANVQDFKTARCRRCVLGFEVQDDSI